MASQKGGEQGGTTSGNGNTGKEDRVNWNDVGKGGVVAGKTVRLDLSPELLWNVLRDIDSENSYYLRMPDLVSDVIRLDDFEAGDLLELGSYWSETRTHPRFGNIRVFCWVDDMTEVREDEQNQTKSSDASFAGVYKISISVRQNGTTQQESESRYSFTVLPVENGSEVSVSFCFLPSHWLSRLLLRFFGKRIAKRGLEVIDAHLTWSSKEALARRETEVCNADIKEK
mmetsp:Transcript_10952/g.16133  ORF Transcript_10952/g.16133 Transcript_10952/m.16133 type:complete len:228 (-) Transcript_10952:206-889(-)